MKEFHSCKEALDSCISQKYFAISHLYFEEKTMHVHIHDCYEIYYSISGGKQFLIDNKTYGIATGDVFFINQYESHHVVEIDQAEHERIVISIHPEFLRTISSPSTALDYCFCHREPGFCHRISLDKEQQQRFMYYIHKINSLSGYAEDIMERIVFTELMIFFNREFFHCSHAVRTTEKFSYQYNQQINDILEYINQNIHTSITIEHLANHFFLSKSFICRIFKLSTGTTINKYLTARRISIAKMLLSEGVSVNEVSERCGFQDYSTFLKSFTKTVGLSPKKYAMYNNRI